MNIIMKDISKVIKKNIILRNINLNMIGGKIYGLIGTNGSGKTMLMRLLAGLIRPSEGEIIVNGHRVEYGKKLYFDMGVIIEKPEFFNDLTGMENLEMLAKLKGKIGRDEMIDAMNRVQLDPNNEKKVKEYSLGMRQRLGIAQAIMEDPEVLILDEVTNALDEEGIKMVYEVLNEEKRKGKIIIISSHNRIDIDTLCDEIYLVKNQSLQVGDN
ncbi:ABC-2 type transport system ATP-binding protein [Kandleria vitulina]|uniref:ABC-2 type transport system ATP-binding protein n=1 Tax=Kandleria vitulina TaxID=1630 RepID=A0A1H2SGX2_9FIRM|nr:ABC transporter ATP-binding protein [Kandleria vitulina]SDW30943.1 ABC-2 type transport system ATP-binding protein [Kandleria vitulina]